MAPGYRSDIISKAIIPKSNNKLVEYKASTPVSQRFYDFLQGPIVAKASEALIQAAPTTVQRFAPLAKQYLNDRVEGALAEHDHAKKEDTGFVERNPRGPISAAPPAPPNYPSININNANYQNMAYYRKKSYRRKGGRKRAAPFRKGYDRRNVGEMRFHSLSRKTPNEMKYVDNTALTGSFTAGVGTITQFGGSAPLLNCPLTQGAGASQRLGRHAFIKSIQIKGWMMIDWTSGSTNNNTARPMCWLVLDRQANGANPVNGATDIFTSTDPDVCLLNMSNTKRFKIMKKWECTLEPSNSDVNGASNNSSCMIDYFTKCNIKIDFKSSTATCGITDIESNNLLIFMGCGGIPAAAVLSASIQVRLRFQD